MTRRQFLWYAQRVLLSFDAAKVQFIFQTTKCFLRFMLKNIIFPIIYILIPLKYVLLPHYSLRLWEEDLHKFLNVRIFANLMNMTKLKR